MAKPIIHQITPFDATQTQRINVTYRGGIISSKTIVIRNSENYGIVWQQTDYIDSNDTNPRKELVIPSNTLINDRRYVMECYFTERSSGAMSEISDKMFFYTRTTPQFKFIGLPTEQNKPEGTLLNTSFIEAKIEYIVPEDVLEDLIYYQLFLYDNNKVLLYSTDVFREIDDYNDLRYVFRGLDNRSYYYIEARGSTENGIFLSTGLCRVYIEYEEQDSYSMLYLKQNAVNGSIEYDSNYIMVQADNENYEYDDGSILLDHDDLRYMPNPYTCNFVIPNNATFSIKGSNLCKKSINKILTCSNGEKTFILYNLVDADGYNVIKLVVPNTVDNTIIYSNKLYFSNLDVVEIYVRQVVSSQGTFFDIDCKVDEDSALFHDLWLGNNRPRRNLEDNDDWLDITKSPTIKIDSDDLIVYVQDNTPDTSSIDYSGSTHDVMVNDSIWLGDATLSEYQE